MSGEVYIHPKVIEMELEKASREAEALTKTPEYKAERAAELATLCREWREKADLTQSRAAQVLGLPYPTYVAVENGRGFRYPNLLVLAMRAFE